MKIKKSHIPEELMALYAAATPTNNTDIPVPQANDLEKIFILTKEMVKMPKTNKGIEKLFGFNERQSGYYGLACIYLGFAERKSSLSGKTKYYPTELGLKIDALGDAMTKDFYIICFEQMMKHEFMYRIFDYVVHNEMLPGKNWIEDMLDELELVDSHTTSGRRASSVLMWYKEIFKNMNVEVEE